VLSCGEGIVPASPGSGLAIPDLAARPRPSWSRRPLLLPDHRKGARNSRGGRRGDRPLERLVELRLVPRIGRRARPRQRAHQHGWSGKNRQPDEEEMTAPDAGRMWFRPGVLRQVGGRVRPGIPLTCPSGARNERQGSAVNMHQKCNLAPAARVQAPPRSWGTSSRTRRKIPIKDPPKST